MLPENPLLEVDEGNAKPLCRKRLVRELCLVS